MNFNIKDLIARIEILEKERLNRDLIVEQAVNIERIKSKNVELTDEIYALRETVLQLKVQQKSDKSELVEKLNAVVDIIKAKKDAVFYDDEIAELRELIALATQDKQAFESARRTFGEQLSKISIELNTRAEELNSKIASMPEPKSYDDDVLKLNEAISALPAPKYYDDELQAIHDKISVLPEPRYYESELQALDKKIESLPTQKLYDDEIKSLLDRINALPSPKFYDDELALINEKIANIPAQVDFTSQIDEIAQVVASIPEPKDFSDDIEEVKKLIPSMPEIKDFSDEISELKATISRIPEPITPKEYDSEIEELSARITSAERDKKAFESARNTFGEQLSKIYIELNNKINEIKGDQNGE